MGIMKPASFLMGLSMLFALGACAAPYGDDSVPEEGSRQETVKSADQSAAIDAARSRVQEDFVRAPSVQGHEIIVVAQRIVTGVDQIALQAKVMKRTADGKELDLDDADFVGVWGQGDSRIASPYRSDLMVVLQRAKDGSSWSTLKTGVLGSRAVEAYVLGETPEAFEGWSQDFIQKRDRQSRTPFPGQ
jgi:hypothetical protein